MSETMWSVFITSAVTLIAPLLLGILGNVTLQDPREGIKREIEILSQLDGRSEIAKVFSKRIEATILAHTMEEPLKAERNRAFRRYALAVLGWWLVAFTSTRRGGEESYWIEIAYWVLLMLAAYLTGGLIATLLGIATAEIRLTTFRVRSRWNDARLWKTRREIKHQEKRVSTLRTEMDNLFGEDKPENNMRALMASYHNADDVGRVKIAYETVMHWLLSGVPIEELRPYASTTKFWPHDSGRHGTALALNRFEEWRRENEIPPGWGSVPHNEKLPPPSDR